MKPEKNNPEQSLRALRILPASESVREKARQRALMAFRSAPSSERLPKKFPAWILQLASVAALILIAVLVMRPSAHNRTDDLQMFTEVEKMFSGQFLAAIKDGDHLDLKLADSPVTLSKDQQILMTFQKSSHRVEVLTYSGQAISLKLNGKTLEVTPLLSGDGSVILLTDSHLFTSAQNSEIAGFSFSARPLSGERS